MRTHVLSKIFFNEDPAASWFCARDNPPLCALSNFLGMHAQEGGGFR